MSTQTLTTPTTEHPELEFDSIDGHPDGIAAGVEAVSDQISTHVAAMAERVELTVAAWLVEARQRAIS